MIKDGTHVSNVDTGDTNTTIVPDRLDHLVQDLGGIGLGTGGQLNCVCPALWVFTSNALKRDIWTVVNHLLQLGDDVLVLGKVQSLDLGVHALDEVESPVLVDHDDTAGTVHERELGAHLTDWAGTPDGDDIALLDTGVDNAVPAGGDDIRKKETLLIWNVVGELEKVDVSTWDADILGLTTGEPTGEMAVTEHTSGVSTVHAVLDLVGVGLLALGGEFLVAVHALSSVSDCSERVRKIWVLTYVSASNLERCNDTVTLLDVLDTRAERVYDTAELVAENVTLLHLDDRTVEKMEVRTADCGAGNLENNIAILDDLWLWGVDCIVC